jgi:ABC-type uncharacterized transport system involved in gliding motility auxiliary subunit
VSLAVGLALFVLVMVNYLGHRMMRRWDISSDSYYKLSDKTRGLLSGLSEPVEVIAFFQRSHELYDDVRNLLKEYEYEVADSTPKRLEIEMIDPDRDLGRTRELSKQYEVGKANLVVFRCAGRTKYVEAKDLADYHYSLEGQKSVRKKKVGFKGEQVFSSAIQSVAQATRPIVYLLQGHGERSIDDFGKLNGFSDLARIMRRDNMEVRPLLLAETGSVPQDCGALIIAGPERVISEPEIDMIKAYLDRRGRVLVMLEPAVITGLEPLLSDWGVELAKDVVVGLSLTKTGRDLIVKDYGKHPITRNLRNIMTMFYLPRSVEPAQPAGRTVETPVDKPKVEVLAMTTEDSWAEYDLRQRPARMDADVDRRGPISVAVAIERGPVSGIDVEIKPTRLVVIGDAEFVSNGALSGGGSGNSDLFMSAVNWLVERETLLAIAPRVPGELRVAMSRQQWRMVYLITVGGIPLGVCLVGIFVWLSRRR